MVEFLHLIEYLGFVRALKLDLGFLEVFFLKFEGFEGNQPVCVVQGGFYRGYACLLLF